MSSVLDPYTGAWDAAAAAHLFDRAGFGAGPGQLDAALERGLEATLDELFAPVGHDPVLFTSIEPLLGTDTLELLAAWWMALIVAGGDPLRERMTLVWHGHFATSNDKVRDVRMMHRQNLVLRELALGDFRQLLHAVARDPAMLVWLDGNLNRRGHPNENFARELLELFALGIGNYAERDVQEAARALTGWGTSGRAFVERPHDHERGPKTVLGRTADFDPDELVTWVAAQPACARHVARRLLHELVALPPGTDEAALDALTEALVASDWNVGATLRVLLRSRLFFAPETRRARISAPVEHVARSIRALGERIAPRQAARAAASMGQALFRPPSVKGWDGGRAWIHAGAWIARHNLAAELVAGAGPELAAALGAPGSQAAAGACALAALLPGPIAPAYAERIERAAAACVSVEEALRAATLLVLTSPEYQLV
jgi:uncharacterized protein (DUF1800 family)